MPKIKSKSCADGSADTYEARLVAAQSLRKGDRVRHQRTGEQGSFQEINLGFALPEVWVHFDSDREISKTLSCNPLELEIIGSKVEQQPTALPDTCHKEALAEVSPNVVLTRVEEASAIIESPCRRAHADVLEELSDSEERERYRLEFKVDRGIAQAWLALKELRDRRLYRSTHKTFEEYAKERFGYNRAHAYRLIEAAQVLENLSPIWRQDVLQDEMSPIGRQKFPNSERLCRELAKLPPNSQPIAWEKVLETSSDKAPTAKLVRGIVEQLQEKPLLQAKDFCACGDVFTLVKLEGSMRKYNGCWAIASGINDFTITVEVHETTLTVKPENLQPIDEPDARRQLPQTLKRIRRLRNVGLLDRGAYNVLEDLGWQTYLTDIEEKLLSCLEEHYKVNSEETP
ncbi:hypothetical protein [Gloeocapsopsis dulcis]|uniref:Uncharacterized protein n=1 Tax=Gloeocapsopsis dulcis AAB1 = 1H9 TaxID=1433147 RepID=A0A6N8G4D2_9CHRO|nr:hypothetical protein [Gloeocapsopsis dulcis]MUL39532.1 hypothetical protein [Gloeocapsopsis dulcis AAB1 = 1H9]WNN92156.1 hypothetical protein P0S91_26620 [Gloeocapsopsis dulcis]